MQSKSVYFCTVLALCLCLCAMDVRGGDVTIKFSEDDYFRRETEGSLSLILVVSGEQDNGDLQFQLEAFTAQQYRDQNLACVDEDGHDFTLPLPANAEEGELADLSLTIVTCSRMFGSTTDVSCDVPLNQDAILEAEEFLVFKLTVTETAGNIITLTRNCAIGRILAPSNPGENISLAVVEENIKVTEGTTNTYVSLDKNFESEVPIEITVQLGDGSPNDGNFYYAPEDGSDYMLNGGQLTATFPANETTLRLPLVIIDDDKVELNEYLTITFQAQINAPGLVTSIDVIPSITNVVIQDNDVVTSGFMVSQDTISVTEGEQYTLCAEIKSHDPQVDAIERSVLLDFTITDGTATSNDDFTLVSQPQNAVSLDFGDSLCYTFEMTENDLVDGPRSFQVEIVDQQLAMITDPAERARHMELNIIQPNTVTINILDNDIGSPNRPTITQVEATAQEILTIEWTTDEEGGARPVECHYGDITEQDSEGRVFMFDFCNGPTPRAQEHAFQQFDSSKEYSIVVCSRNRLGMNCSEPEIFNPIVPPTTDVIVGTGTTVPPIPMSNLGLIVGVVVGVVVLLCCCLILIILLCIFCLCCSNREKRYFPERREKQFAKEAYRHNAHYSVAADELDIVKEPLYSV